jgi:hypothetical protein
LGLIAWLDNEHLLIDRGKVQEDQLMYEPHPQILWNPFTGDTQDLNPTFPQIEFAPDYDWYEYASGEVVYDPSLQLAVYPTIPYTIPYGEVVLWDMQVKHSVDMKVKGAVATLTGGTGSAPKWSPDGQYFLTNQKLTLDEPSLAEERHDQELFSVSRTGEVKRLTYLTEAFKEVEFWQFSWSPDGRSVAFWMVVKPDKYPGIMPNDYADIYRLAVLDLASGQVTNTCIRGGADGIAPNGGSYSGPPEPPLWSPDSRQLLVKAMNLGKGSYAVVVDLAHGFAARVGDNKIPIGWLLNYP